jgi:hypothetical protein
MPGIAALRHELDVASKLQEVSAYQAKLGVLRDRFGHRIAILLEGRERMARFNCFAYALGLWDHADYIRLVDAKNDSTVINSCTISEMLSEGALVEIDSNYAKANDMVVYFDDGRVTHAAVVGDKGAVRSKWGANEVHEHAVWDVPTSYGDVVRYFRRPAPETVLRRFAPDRFKDFRKID